MFFSDASEAYNRVAMCKSTLNVFYLVNNLLKVFVSFKCDTHIANVELCRNNFFYIIL